MSPQRVSRLAFKQITEPEGAQLLDAHIRVAAEGHDFYLMLWFVVATRTFIIAAARCDRDEVLVAYHPSLDEALRDRQRLMAGLGLHLAA